jgi:serine/threonine-protein kinase PpkA
VNSTILLKSVDIRIPGYRILRPLGEGGMASVFLAVQESLDREVALKIMAPALAANAEFTERFIKEGRITAKLSHANLVTVFDIGSHGAVYYLAAEFIPGGSLRERVQEGMSVGEALDVACDVARGLDYAHQKGFVHRDVKPGNILFKADGTAVLADFGIAKAMDSKSGATMAGASIGTPDYMSPEQARAEAVDGRSDIYALGAVLYEMLVGHPPYQAADPFTVALMHVTQPVPALPPEHAWLQPLIDMTMAKLPANRPANGEAFVQAVEQLLAASPQAASISQARAVKKRAQGSNRLAGSTQRTAAVADGRPAWVLPVAAMVALAVVIGGVWLAMRPAAVAPSVTTPTIETPTVEPTGTNPIAMTVTTDPPINIPTPIDTPASEIASLLMQADAYRDYGTTKEPGRRLSYPPGDNAVDLYKRVLEAEPDNAAALAGLASIAAYYLKSAQLMCDREIWSQCRTLATDGLKAEAGNLELKALEERAGKRALGG